MLADPALGEVIDLAKPACVVLGLVPGFLPARQIREVVAGYADAVAAGSIIVISSLRIDGEALWKDFRAAWTSGPLHNHSRRQVAGFLAGLELVPPGVVPADPACMLAAVAASADRFPGILRAQNSHGPASVPQPPYSIVPR